MGKRQPSDATLRMARALGARWEHAMPNNPKADDELLAVIKRVERQLGLTGKPDDAYTKVQRRDLRTLITAARQPEGVSGHG